MPNVDAAGLDLIRSYEGCSLNAYWDSIGECWTIGYGHTGPDVHDGQTITPAQAETLFDQDVDRFAQGVNNALAHSVNPNQFAALVSLAYNIGMAAFNASHALLYINENDYPDALASWARWVHDGNGNVVQGLVNRRDAEIALFQEAS